MRSPAVFLAAVLRLPARVQRCARGAAALGLFCAGVVLCGSAGAQFNGDYAQHRLTLDAENFLDWRAYQPPYRWRQDYLRAPNYFRGTVGSLSQKVFYVSEEIRLEKPLGNHGSMHYLQREDAFHRSDPLYQEVEFRLGRTGSASLIGFPRHDKTLGGVGAAVAYGSRTDWDYVRLSHLAQYRLYNAEHVGEEFFAQAPALDRLEARTFWRERVLVQIDLREERPSEFITPSSAAPALAKRERYRGRKAELGLDVHWTDGLVTGLAYRTAHERRGRFPLHAASGVSEAQQALRSDWWDAYAVVKLAGGSVVESGLYRGGFRNHIAGDAGTAAFAHHLTTDAAYLMWDWPQSDTFLWRLSFQGGRAERATQDAAKPHEASSGRTTEMKAGVGVVLEQAGSHAVLFNSTWDLDVFAHRQWDGGNVQLLWLF